MAASVETISKGPKVTRHAWKDLGNHYKKVKEVHLRQLFADDPKRGVRMTAEALGLFLDYSKNRITAETVNLLLKLAGESRLRERIDAMFSGEKINITEKRAVLHTALRAPRGASIVVDGENVVPKVHAVLTGKKTAAKAAADLQGELQEITGLKAPPTGVSAPQVGTQMVRPGDRTRTAN